MFRERRLTDAADTADLDNRQSAAADLNQHILDLGASPDEFPRRRQIRQVRSGDLRAGSRLRLTPFEQIAEKALERRSLQFILDMAGGQPYRCCDLAPGLVVYVAQSKNLSVELWPSGGALAGQAGRSGCFVLEPLDPLAQERCQFVPIDP